VTIDPIFRGKVPFVMILTVVLVLVLISFNPPVVFLAIFSIYVLSGLVETLWGLRKKRRNKRAKKASRSS